MFIFINCFDDFDFKNYFLFVKSEIERKKKFIVFFVEIYIKFFVVKEFRVFERLVKCFLVEVRRS